jgi:hypothetical protein
MPSCFKPAGMQLAVLGAILCWRHALTVLNKLGPTCTTNGWCPAVEHSSSCLLSVCSCIPALGQKLRCGKAKVLVHSSGPACVLHHPSHCAGGVFTVSRCQERDRAKRLTCLQAACMCYPRSCSEHSKNSYRLVRRLVLTGRSQSGRCTLSCCWDQGGHANNT